MFKVIKVAFNEGWRSGEIVLHTPVKDFADRILDEINDGTPTHFAVTIKLF